MLQREQASADPKGTRAAQALIANAELLQSVLGQESYAAMLRHLSGWLTKEMALFQAHVDPAKVMSLPIVEVKE